MFLLILFLIGLIGGAAMLDPNGAQWLGVAAKVLEPLSRLLM